MNRSTHSSSRRSFLKKSALFGGLSILPSSLVFGANARSPKAISPNDKVKLAVVGIGNQGFQDLKLMADSGLCDIVALCDVDLKGKHTQAAQQRYASQGNGTQGARCFTDFRKMFDTMADDIDAVLIATPDHSHFAVTMLAMSLGKHVFVEKPLAHTFGQCERLIEMAAKNPQLVTQMGNQGHSGANYFQFKAWSEAGLIKDITRITAHMNRKRRWHGWGEKTTAYPKTTMPEGLDWDQWIDSAPHTHPFSNKLHPQEWRSWFDYGSGCFGDWGPHILDTCHRFLQLGLPETIKAVRRDGVNAAGLIYPQASTIRFSFPERGDGLPACDVDWYDGVNNVPQLEGAFTSNGKAKPLTSPGKVLYGKDIVFQGGSHASPLRILPREKYIEMHPTLPKLQLKNSNHYANFLLACMGKEKARSPFSVAGPLTQVFTLGILAQRFGGELQFDRKQKTIINNDTAKALLDPAPREGWESYYQV
ncbi:Gfo/Idh/MocA family oxidoreductase [Verrucomicrobiaceae bacterium N1E253]|uniref:Gfo/Idh/MocA family oxidoreductase n=1 Tax=Oceaniferula marina TaxID=2748318 RepID=A0A851GP53_9BACT|nr:Gfo/Idh/MocA family oxidoreductase [Oceaniferula marina]NWK55924.1 Gfo/Idh/MocA family oxidoreductase [Oceaniferula marina]